TIPLPDSLKPSQSTVTIRTNGFSVGDPLYIVDGVEAKNGIGYLDPKNIQSIDVQNGLAGTAIYGEKAKYGIIKVTTKSK
ncbi:MAG: hypothetical protein EOO39_41920, partial [Cytophagaceae bacterium]